MFIKIGPKLKNDIFSYIICKNPASSPFKLKLKDNRTYDAWFSDNDQYFNISLENDSLDFLKRARELNLANYVNNQLTSVCPYNIKCLDVTLRSAIRGNNSSGEAITDEQFNSNLEWECIIGPYAEDIEFIKSTFNTVDILAESIEDKNVEFSHMLKLTNNTPISLTEFLQKIYIMSCYITQHESMYPTTEQTIDKFVTICKNWINSCSIRNKVIKKLSKYSKKLVSQFSEGLEEANENTEDEVEYKYEIEKFLNKISLHERRHKLIASIINKLKCKTIVDLGCSEGSMITELFKYKELESLKILAFDSNPIKVRKINKKFHSGFNVLARNCNILYPNIDKSDLNPDMVTCIEIIEHLETHDRIRLLKLIRKVYVPKQIILTTPNIEYNKHFNLEPNTLRRRDHKTEYTFNEFNEIIVTELSKSYDISFVKLNNLSSEQYVDIEFVSQNDLNSEWFSNNIPNFIIIGTHKKHISGYENYFDNMSLYKKIHHSIKYGFNYKEQIKNHIKTNQDKLTLENYGFDYKMFRSIKDAYHSIHLERSNYTVKEKEIASGLCSKQFSSNINNIFYLAPTISPVDYIGDENNEYKSHKYLEHPRAAFEYYRARGINELVAEYKYMGSRAHILVFKDIEKAIAMGYGRPVIILSRNGYNFFDGSSPYYDFIYDDIKDKMTSDFIIFDAEILPWSLKAGKLIKYDFLMPGECAYLSRKYSNKDYTSAEKFISTVKVYSNEGDLEIYPFHILAYGDIEKGKNNRYRFINYVNGYEQNHIWHAMYINKFENDIFKRLNYHYINLKDKSTMDHSVEQWEKYCINGLGEGFVYKPMNFKNISSSGYLIQPALKVRGPEYLRIIYGIDYLDEEYFKKLTFRKISSKRKMAVQESELSEKILLTFLNNNIEQKNRYVSAFIGLDGIGSGSLDATL